MAAQSFYNSYDSQIAKKANQNIKTLIWELGIALPIVLQSGNQLILRNLNIVVRIRSSGIDTIANNSAQNRKFSFMHFLFKKIKFN